MRRATSRMTTLHLLCAVAPTLVVVLSSAVVVFVGGLRVLGPLVADID